MHQCVHTLTHHVMYSHAGANGGTIEGRNRLVCIMVFTQPVSNQSSCDNEEQSWVGIGLLCIRVFTHNHTHTAHPVSFSGLDWSVTVVLSLYCLLFSVVCCLYNLIKSFLIVVSTAYNFYCLPSPAGVYMQPQQRLGRVNFFFTVCRAALFVSLLNV